MHSTGTIHMFTVNVQEVSHYCVTVYVSNVKRYNKKDDLYLGLQKNKHVIYLLFFPDYR